MDSTAHRRTGDIELFPHSSIPDGSRSAKDRRQTAGFYPFLSGSDVDFSVIEDDEIYSLSEINLYNVINNDIYSISDNNIYSISEQSDLYAAEEN